MEVTHELQLDAMRLQSDISTALGDTSINCHYFNSCESTNLECLKLAEHNSVVIAEHQTAGRGRRGNDWHSPQAQNIYCSIGMNKQIQAEYLGLVSLRVGLSIVDVLRTQTTAEVSLKWPNDILLQGKKLGGILIETRSNGADNFFLVIGFGLNINLSRADIEQINQPVISLHQATQQMPERQNLLSELISQIMQDVQAFMLHDIDAFIRRFNQADHFHGKKVRVKTAQQEISGIHFGIDKTGQIQVQTGNGIELFSAAEISLREITDVTD